MATHRRARRHALGIAGLIAITLLGSSACTAASGTTADGGSSGAAFPVTIYQNVTELAAHSDAVVIATAGAKVATSTLDAVPISSRTLEVADVLRGHAPSTITIELINDRGTAMTAGTSYVLFLSRDKSASAADVYTPMSNNNTGENPLGDGGWKVTGATATRVSSGGRLPAALPLADIRKQVAAA